MRRARCAVVGALLLFVGQDPLEASPIADSTFWPTTLQAIATVDDSVSWAETFKVGTSGYLSEVQLLLLGDPRGDLLIQILGPNPFGFPDSNQVLGSILLAGAQLPQNQPSWVSLDFASLNIHLAAGQTAAVALSTSATAASFNWYGDHTSYAGSSSWSKPNCCSWSGDSGTTLGFATSIDTNPYSAPVPVPEPTTLSLVAVSAVVTGVRRARLRR
jgi:hypothetical protein